MTPGGKNQRLGCTWYEEPGESVDPQIRIEFHSEAIYEPRCQVLFDTLLHEMIHVYFMLYACADSTCVCSQGGLSANLGDERHGRAFLWLARVLEDVSERMLGWKADVWSPAHHHMEVMGGEMHYLSHDLWVCWQGEKCMRPRPG